MTWTSPLCRRKPSAQSGMPLRNCSTRRSMKTIMRVGIDLSKNVFVVYGVDDHEQSVLKKTLKRAELLPFFAQLEASLIGMEAGSGAHHWAREMIKLGHDARIMHPRLLAPNRNQVRNGRNNP